MKILLAISRDEEREGAVSLCVEAAASLGASVRALFVVDSAGIRRAEAGAHIGSIHLAQEAEAQIAGREAADGRRALDAAADRFRAAGIPFSGEVADGDPAELVPRAAAECDLAVSGLRSVFGYREEEPGQVALSIMKERAAPVLLAAWPSRPVRTVVVGCGGGPRTAAAVRALVRVGLWRAVPRTVLLAIDDSAEGGRRRIEEPRRILLEAGYGAAEEAVLPGPKLPAFEGFLDMARADAVVLGGFGEHRWNDLFGGSVTGMLAGSARRHLFLYM